MSNAVQPSGLTLSNSVYDKTKWVAQYLIPALATLYFALAEIWGLPYATQIIGTMVALDTFLGVLLGLSKSQYLKSDAWFDGNLMITEEDGSERWSLDYLRDLDSLKHQETVTFKVRDASELDRE